MRAFWCSLISVLSVVSTTSLGMAQEGGFQPPAPQPESLDWVRMSSGEWLRGEIGFLRKDQLEFDSEDLDLLTLDWEDVAEVISPRTLTLVFDDGSTFTGTTTIRDDTVAIRTAAGTETRPRSQLLSILEGYPSGWDLWSGRATIGLVFRSGNSDQSDLNALLRLKRDSPRTRFDNRYEGNFGTLDEVQSVNNHRYSGTLDFFIYRNLFFTLPTIEVFSDKFQNIDYRLTVGAGVGYDLLRDGDLEWSASLGGGYQKTRYRSVSEGEERENDTGTALVATNLEWEINDATDVALTYSGQISIPEVKDANHHTVLALSVEAFDDVLDITTSLTWDRVETPRPDENGEVPVRDDFRMSVGIGVDF